MLSWQKRLPLGTCVIDTRYRKLHKICPTVLHGGRLDMHLRLNESVSHLLYICRTRQIQRCRHCEANANENLQSISIDRAHDLYLRTLLRQITLVNADGIDSDILAEMM